jgi:hypothetical protein
MCIGKPKLPEPKVTASPAVHVAKDIDPKLELATPTTDADTIRNKLFGKRGLRIDISRSKDNSVGTQGLSNTALSVPTA